MTQINILSLGASFELTRNKPAIGASAIASKENEKPNRSRPGSDSTLVEEDRDLTSAGTTDWIAGVGDICNRASRDVLDQAIVTTPTNWKQVKLSKPLKMPKNTQYPHHTKRKRSALQRHCDFWDADHDGVIYPWDIYIGFRKLGFNIALCLWAAITMAFCSSYSTQGDWLPHPLFAINVNNIHQSRHGSTTATYDLDAEIDMRRFHSVFHKYAEGKEYLTCRTLYNVWAGQCCANDWFGWFAGGLEWIALYILLWPQDGKLMRDDILGVFDGTIFEKIARRRAQSGI